MIKLAQTGLVYGTVLGVLLSLSSGVMSAEKKTAKSSATAGDTVTLSKSSKSAKSTSSASGSTKVTLGKASKSTKSGDAVTLKGVKSTKSSKPSSLKPIKAAPKPKEAAPVYHAPSSGTWVLRCSGSSPKWRAEVLPKWVNGIIGGKSTGMPITSKYQVHGKRNNVALRTTVRGAGAGGNITLNVRYKVCQGKPFRVSGSFNDRAIGGCCQSVRVR